MPTIKGTVYLNPVPTDQFVRVIIAKALVPGTEVNQEEYHPPFVGTTQAFSVACPTFEVYRTRIYKVPESDPGSIGILISEYDVEPRLDVPEQPDNTEMLVGRGDPQDPANGDTSKIIPDTAGLMIKEVYKLGIGPLPHSQWQQIADPTPGSELIGIELIGEDDIGGPIVFTTGEQFSIEYAITVNGNAAGAISDISQALDDHINNVSNPHATTKAQVGLSNIPNAISDAINLNSSATLATSKAVNDLRLSISNNIITAQYYASNVGANSDKLFTVLHGNMTDPNTYIIVATLYSLTVDWNAGNDMFFTVREKIAGSFKFAIRNLGANALNFQLHYAFIKIV